MKKANAAKGKRVLSLQVKVEDYERLLALSKRDFKGLVKPARLGVMAFEAGLKIIERK